MNIELEGIVRGVLHPRADLIPTLKVSKEARAIDQVWMSPTSLGWMCRKGKKWQLVRRRWEARNGCGYGEPTGPNGDRVVGE